VHGLAARETACCHPSRSHPMSLRPLLLAPLLLALTTHAQDGTDNAGATRRPASPTIGSDNRSVGVSIAQGFVRSCGVVRKLAPSPALRPFESLAHLAPRSSEVLYAVSIGSDSPEAIVVIDGVAELAPEWTHDYPPVVPPTGEAHRLHVYPEELP
jgi:hypothetical protein